MKLGTRRQIAIMGALLGLGILALAGARNLTAAQALVQQALANLRQQGPWVFFGSMAILPAFGFPLLPFALAAGPAFGPEMGSAKVGLLATFSVSINTAISYWLARSAVRPALVRMMAWLEYRLPNPDPQSAWATTLAVRLAPGLPFWAQSYALGAMGTPWWPYLIVSTLVPAAYLFGAVYAGEAAWRGGAGAAAFGLGLIVFAAATFRIWRTRRRPAVPAAPANR